MRNPFDTAFGRVPAIILDRTDLVERIAEDLHYYNSPYRTTLISGLRGSGKTVLLTDICEQLRQQDNCIVVDLRPHLETDEMIAQLLEKAILESPQWIKPGLVKLKETSLKLPFVETTIESRPLSEESQLLQLLQHLKKQNTLLVVAIDEVDNTPAIRNLASMHQEFLRRRLDMALLFTGLPEKVNALQNENMLTFLLRAERITPESLSPYSIRQAYQENFQAGGYLLEDGLVEKMTNLTKGYAYAFQVLGSLLWEAEKENLRITEESLNKVESAFMSLLFQNVHAKVFSEISPTDQAFLYAMISEESSTSVQDIARHMERDKNYISVYRGRLLKAGIIQVAGHGRLSYTLPYMKEFLEEQAKWEM